MKDYKEDLKTLVEDIDNYIPYAQAALDETNFRPEIKQAFAESFNHYYPALFAICDALRLLGPVMTLDMGTYQGNSARAMAAAGAWVDTIDIDMKPVIDLASLEHTCRVKKVEQDTWRNIPYGLYDFIMVDMAHDGEIETQLHAILDTTYNGYAFYDDVDLNDGMKKFWASVPDEQKIFVPQWHMPAYEGAPNPGFGIVRYGE